VKDLWKTFGEAEMAGDRGGTAPITAGAALAPERVELFYIDPATEARPICRREPWLAPTVIRVRVNPLGDDEARPGAVPSVQGGCGDSPEDEDGRP
jgi:hypothetical protein